MKNILTSNMTTLATLVSLTVSAMAASDDFVGMFNGKDLTGWRKTGNWVVEQDNVVTLKPWAGESGWKRFNDYIATEGQYGDFMLDLSKGAMKDRPARGQISFQDEGKRVWYRNFRIKELGQP